LANLILHQADAGRESCPKPPFNLQEIKLIEPAFLQMQILAQTRKRPQNKGVQDTSRTTHQRDRTHDGAFYSCRRSPPLIDAANISLTHHPR
jgi:hypothetical protein